MKHFACYSPFQMKDKEGVKYILEVVDDSCPDDPRNWDNVCTMICFHRRYQLGDSHNYDSSDEFFDDILYNICDMEYEDFEKLSTREKYKIACESDKIYIQELNLYDHGGVTVSTSCSYPYNDYWDAGCVGWVYVSKERAMIEWGGIPERDENGEYIRIPHEHHNGSVTYSTKYIPITEENWKEVAEYHMDNEVKIYDQYLRGDVYGYKLIKKVVKKDVCPHCGKVTNEYEEEREVDSCWGFYGDCLEENGIIDNLCDLEFVEEE